MKYLTLIALLAGALSLTLMAQYPQGSWQDNFSYNNGSFVTSANGIIYCATKSGIIVADIEYSSVSRLSTVGGLSESDIKTIAWSDETSTLIIAYNSTNIDLLRGNAITSIPDIMRKSISGLKEIYRIRTHGDMAYLACSFGIVIIDLSREEIFDTWKPGTGTESNPVYDIAFDSERIFAATGSGVYEAELNNQGLAYFGNWTKENGLPSPEASYTCIAHTGGNLFVNKLSLAAEGDSVFLFNGSWQYLYKTTGGPNISFETSEGNKVIISSSYDVKIYSASGVLQEAVTEYGLVPASPSNAIKSGATLWVADQKSGLVAVNSPSDHNFYLPDGPDYNSVAYLSAHNGNVLIAGGAVDNAWNNTWKMLEVSLYKNNKWSSLPESSFRDAMRIIPGKNDNYFVSTWGMGLLEFSDTTLLNHYNEYNSPLISIIPGQPFTRLCGLAFDKDDNLWVIHSGVDQNIKVLRPNRTWVTLSHTIDAPTIGDIIISRNGIKWVVLPRGHGLFVLDDNNTLEDTSDDMYRRFPVRDNDDRLISGVYSVVEDLDGNIWVGTDQGPAIYYNPDRAAKEDIKAVRIKIPRNDGTGLSDFLLGTEIITSITVDGANRKWMGTFNSGVYLISADGTREIEHFTAENSPLPSNTVVSVSADPSTGLIWFGTSEGVIAYRGDAPAGGENFSNVYSFPNPVRPDYFGRVTITGLIRDTSVKITDISGNLVYQTISNGSEATWDLMNYRGERVSSGVYLAFCASPDGHNSTVIKMLIVKGR